MLQILSGRFFGDGRVEERETDAVLYSNLSWIAPIPTAVMELRPADGLGQTAVSSYVLRYKNRLERDEGPLVLADSSEAVDQFRLLASLWFKAFFHPDHQRVELSAAKHRATHSTGVSLALSFLAFSMLELGRLRQRWRAFRRL